MAPFDAARAWRRFKALKVAASELAVMRHSAFPYRGENPDTERPFLDAADGRRHGHTSPQGQTYWEDETYSDRRTLLHLPAGFSLARPAALVVFFHGNFATLERDVEGRQHVAAQLASSGLNAALAAPQLAVDARDSSPGNFWRKGYFAAWLAEACARLAKLHGQGAEPYDFSRLPVILVAFSGGYYPTAWCLKAGGATRRIAGVVLLDALYGDTDKFAAWIAARHARSFFFSAYTTSSRKWNLELQDELRELGIHWHSGLPRALRAGNLDFFEVTQEIDHVEFMSQAWTPDPLSWVLARVEGFRR